MSTAPAMCHSEATHRSAAERPLLLAVDGGIAASAAVQVVAELARTKLTAVEVLTVERPSALPIVTTEAALVSSSLHRASGNTHRRRLQLRGQIDLLAGRQTHWPIDVEVGTPSAVITREASRRRSRMIALGLQPHRVLDRILYGTTTLGVVRHAQAPVLAVTPSLTAAPRRIVVGVDFSRASLRAARAALDLLAPGGTLLLTYVAPVDPAVEFTAEETEGWNVIYSHGIAGAFARLRQELDPPASIVVDTVFLEGPVGPALLDFTGAAQADVIAVGTHRHAFVDRLLVGSVTERLVREARRSLLVSPPGAP